MNFSRVLQTVLVVSLSIIFGLLHLNNGLIFAQTFAVVCVAIFIFFRLNLSTLGIPKFSQLYRVALLNNKLPLFLLPATAIDVITAQLPIPLITLWFSSQMAGFYSMAWRFLGLPMAVLGGAIAAVFFQKFSETWPDVVRAKSLLFTMWKILALLGILPTILVFVYAEDIAKFFLGDAWAPVGVIVSLMVPMSFVGFISSSTSTTYLVLGLQKYSFCFVVSALIYRPLSLWIGYVRNDIYIGLLFYVTFEIIQNIAYQYIAWKHICSKEVN